MDTQLWVGYAEPTPEKMERIRNRPGFPKPTGGFWTSTLLEDGTSDWTRWCLSEEFGGWNRAYSLEVNSKAKVFVIDSVNDLNKAWVISGSKKSFDPVFGMTPEIDFEALAEKYDAVRLTAQGVVATMYSEPLNLYGWDVESTLWFRWAFTKCKQVKAP